MQDGGETPDTQDAIFDFPGFTAVWSHREAAQGEPAGSGLVFYGTKGSLSISRSGFTITPDRVIRPENAVPQFTDGQPVGGVAARPRTDGDEALDRRRSNDKSGNSLDQFRRHVRNFLDCVKSRQTANFGPGERSPRFDGSATWRISRCVWGGASPGMPRPRRSPGMTKRQSCSSGPYRAPWDRELKAVVT